PEPFRDGAYLEMQLVGPASGGRLALGANLLTSLHPHPRLVPSPDLDAPARGLDFQPSPGPDVRLLAFGERMRGALEEFQSVDSDVTVQFSLASGVKKGDPAAQGEDEEEQEEVPAGHGGGWGPEEDRDA